MPTIALVDDDRNILASVSIALESEGYRVLTYTDGSSALDGFQTGLPDLAILDIDLGGREVFPAARILGARGIPFLCYTGRPQRDALETDFAGVPFCTKPMATDRLIATLVGMAPVAA